jgi:Protein of unknown function (DUF2809)
MIRFNIIYFLLALSLFLVEVLIAHYLYSGFIRAYGGDFLVVIFIYCVVKSFIKTPVFATACWVLIFAYAIEISQYFHLISMLGLQNSRIAKLILGTTFSMIDMLTYTVGIALVIIAEYLIRRKWKIIL